MNTVRDVFGALASALHMASAVTERGPLIAAALLLLSPVGPHLRWEYQYTESAGTRFYMRCSYLGSRGLIAPAIVDNCPLLAWLDTRETRR